MFLTAFSTCVGLLSSKIHNGGDTPKDSQDREYFYKNLVGAPHVGDRPVAGLVPAQHNTEINVRSTSSV